MTHVTRILEQICQGDSSVAGSLLEAVYGELRSLAGEKLGHERTGQTLQATALVHEAYLRLVDSPANQTWNGRGHLFAAAAEAMRRILIENARRKRRLKHGGGQQRVNLELLKKTKRCPDCGSWSTMSMTAFESPLKLFLMSVGFRQTKTFTCGDGGKLSMSRLGREGGGVRLHHFIEVRGQERGDPVRQAQLDG